MSTDLPGVVSVLTTMFTDRQMYVLTRGARNAFATED